ncbi:MAG: hypothetical protein GF346_07710, partial [Candidatus Eisenbacteria bacterium]|nr:hypothetical protein [Candidatus Latescibacterota bacterium]MBD3302318.1 hypothetical protein [Candidatus Eisenbacteria bacterium]
MEAPLRPTRAVSVLGHPVTGLAPILLLSFGWILLAVTFVPRLLAQLRERGLDPSLASL